MRRFISLIAGADTVPFLEAYFDESGTHDNSPIMCIAGYLFDKENCQALDLAWKTVLDEYELPYFHMVDCAHHSFPFDRLTKDECDKVARKMIALIRGHTLFGMGIALADADYTAAMAGMPPIILSDLPVALPGSSYSWCCWTALNAIGQWIGRNGFDGEVAYFFEAGHKHADEANKIMDRIVRIPSLRRLFRYGGHSFVPNALSA